ncbi:MAG TPA: NAD-binding protein [Dissulfurispiraceae bacterium]
MITPAEISGFSAAFRRLSGGLPCLRMIYERLKAIVIALIVVFFTGVSGYELIEGWRTLDALYMTIITLASVGYMEVHPLSDHGRIFTMFLILGGTGVLVYGISTITAFIVEGELSDALRRRRMQNTIDKLRGHYIVCGADQTGRYVIEELVRTQKDFVVIEKDPEKFKQLQERGILCVEGDATHNAVLQSAGIRKAKGLISTLHSDAENLFVVFTARKLNPGLRVIAKAVEEESEQKIRMAGADGVVMPNFIGGLRMVSEMVRPSVVTFLDVMLRSKDKTIRVEEICIEADSPLKGKSLEEADILGVEGATVVALSNKTGGPYTFNPPKTAVLAENDVIITMGDIAMIKRIKDRAKPPALS